MSVKIYANMYNESNARTERVLFCDNNFITVYCD